MAAVSGTLSSSTFAVLGGGISGLVAAHHLLSKVKDPGNVTVFEASSRVGGWINSVVTEEGAVFESGPRSLRTVGEQGRATLKLISDLGFADRVLPAKSSHPGSRNRFIYSGGKLHQLPTGIASVIRKQSLFSKSLLPLFLREPFVKAKLDDTDESVYSFFQRRLGTEVAEYLSDPLCRGIFAGDCRVLSLKSCFPQIYQLEQQYGSIIKGGLFSREVPNEDYSAYPIIKKAKDESWSAWSLPGGLQTLVDKLHETLQHRGANVLRDAACSSLEFISDGTVHVSAGGETHTFDRVISALPAASLARLLPQSHGLLSECLQKIESVSVAVVNLEYEGDVLPVQGFGFLVPSNEPLDILGVIFDSCGFPQNDRPSGSATRLTVMMGGHWFGTLFGDPEEVDPNIFTETAIERIEETLGIKEKPMNILTSIQKNCIPQYKLGHSELLRAIFGYIDENNVPLSLIGSSYNGVAMNDCIMNAQRAVDRIMSCEASVKPPSDRPS